MKLIEFPEQSVVIAKDQPEYLPMPAWVNGDNVICCWKLSYWERLKLLFTGKVWHRMLTFREPVQPQCLQVDYPFTRKSYSLVCPKTP